MKDKSTRSPNIKSYPEHESNPFPMDNLLEQPDYTVPGLHIGEKCVAFSNKYPNVMYTLDKPGMKGLLYITSKLVIGVHEVCISQVEFNEYGKYKQSNRYAYYKALDQLLETGVIARKKNYNNCFFVNPEVMQATVEFFYK